MANKSSFAQNLARVGFLKPLAAGVVAIVILVVIIAWMAGVFVEKIEPSPTSEVSTVLGDSERSRIDEVHEVERPYFEQAVGTLKAASRTEVSARIMAPITEVAVKAGDSVVTGDVLVRLDPRDFEAKRSQAQAALEAANAAASQAQVDYRRDWDLYQEKVIQRAKIEQSSTNVRVAKANVDRARQALTEAEIMLSYTTIAATKSGTIIDRLAEPGDTARPGEPILVLYDPESLRLEVPVKENLAVNLKVGDVLTVHIDALDHDVEARVDEIVPQAEAASRSFLVKVALPRSDNMYEGMFGRLQIPSGQRRHLCLATDAIQTIGQLQFVEIVSPDGNTKQRRFITTGRLGKEVGKEDRVEVLSGLQAGDKVLLRTAESRPPEAEDE